MRERERRVDGLRRITDLDLGAVADIWSLLRYFHGVPVVLHRSHFFFGLISQLWLFFWLDFKRNVSSKSRMNLAFPGYKRELSEWAGIVQ